MPGDVRASLARIGFRDVWQLPFYGHRYYARIPALDRVQARLADWLARNNVTVLASFNVTIVRK